MKSQHESNLHGISRILIFSSKVKAKDRCNENIARKLYADGIVILCGWNEENQKSLTRKFISILIFSNTRHEC